MHFLQSVPPQSMSDSVPFRTPSVQLAATQALPLQILLTQSFMVTQRFPFAHAVHEVPPQSMSVSVPFILASVHDVHVPTVQRALVQSLFDAQCLPSEHLEQMVPPQSTSDSSQF